MDSIGGQGESDIEDIRCKICHEPGSIEEPLYSPCLCRGSMKYIHNACLLQWVEYQSVPTCQICHHKLVFRKVFKHGIPSKIPIALILMDFCVEFCLVLKNMMYQLLFLCRLIMIYYYNCFSLSSKRADTQGFIILLMIFFNLINFAIYISIRKTILRHIDSGSDSHTPVDDTMRAVGSSISSDAGCMMSEGVAFETVLKYIYNPLDVQCNLRLFCATSCFGTIMYIIKLIEFFGSHVQIRWEKMYAFRVISTVMHTQILWDYFLFLKQQHIFLFLKKYTIFITMYFIVLLALYYIHRYTESINWKVLYYYFKVYLITTLFSLYLFCLQGTMATFIKYRLSGISYDNGTSNNPFFELFSTGFYVVLGGLIFNLIKTINKAMMATFRSGLFRFSYKEKNSLIIKQALEYFVSKFVINSIWSHITLLCITTLLCYDLPVFEYSSAFEKYFITLCYFGVFKRSDNVIRFFINQYCYMTRKISSMFGLDNFLYGKKSIRLSKSQLYWASNTEGDLSDMESIANKNIKICINPETMIEDMLLGAEESRSDASNNGYYNITNTKFLKYFGRKHKKLLTIVYKPKYTNLIIMFIKLLCVGVTRVQFYMAFKLINYLSEILYNMISRRIGMAFVSRPVIWWGILNVFIKLLVDFSNTLQDLCVIIYTHMWQPFILSMCLSMWHNRTTSFINTFYVCSMVVNFSYFVFKTLLVPANANLSRRIVFQILFAMTFINVVCIVVYKSISLIYCKYMFQWLAGLYLGFKLAFAFKRLFKDNFIEYLREKYYLQEKFVENYNENK